MFFTCSCPFKKVNGAIVQGVNVQVFITYKSLVQQPHVRGTQGFYNLISLAF